MLKFSERNNLGALNLITSAIGAALGILIPLYMLEKGFGIAEIGIIFAVFPLVFLVIRTILAGIGDVIGTRKIFALAGVSSAASVLTYMVANSAPLFAFGQVLDGVKASAFWAVNRTEAYRIGNGEERKVATIMLGLRGVGEFIGRLGIGATIIYLGFTNSLAALFVLSIVLIYFALRVKNENGQKLDISSVIRQFRERKGSAFIPGSIVVGISSLSYDAPFALLLPVFFAQKAGMSALEIGAMLGVFAIISAITTLGAVKKKIDPKWITIGTIIAGSIPFLLIDYVSKEMLFPLILVIALGYGLKGNLFEAVVQKSVGESKAVSTDIAVLHIPYRFGEIAVLAGLGIVASQFGYAPAFAFVGITGIIYAVAAYIFVKE